MSAYGAFPGNQPGNGSATKSATGVGFSERKFHLLCDFHKSLRDFFGSVAGVHCRGFTLPALLPAIFREHPGIGKVVPACDTMVHNVVDLPDFPLFQLVKGVIQGFPEKLLGTHHDQQKAPVAETVKGQEVQGVGSAAEHALPQPILRVGFVWDFIFWLDNVSSGWGGLVSIKCLYYCLHTRPRLSNYRTPLQHTYLF